MLNFQFLCLTKCDRCHLPFLSERGIMWVLLSHQTNKLLPEITLKDFCGGVTWQDMICMLKFPLKNKQKEVSRKEQVQVQTRGRNVGSGWCSEIQQVGGQMRVETHSLSPRPTSGMMIISQLFLRQHIEDKVCRMWFVFSQIKAEKCM